MTPSRFRTILFVTGTLAAAAIAQAQQPPQDSKAAAAAATASTPVASRPSQKAAADSKTSQAQDAKVASAQKPADPSAQLIKDARNAGFKPENIRGTMMFCRTAVELGSNFPVRTCYDEEQAKIKIHEYQTQRNQLEQMHNIGMITH